MTYTQEFDVDTFPFWSDAKDTIAEVKKAKKMDELQEFIEDCFTGSVPTKTQINDLVWFSRECILLRLGILKDEE